MVRQASDQSLLEKIDPLARGRCGAEALAQLDPAPSPQIIEAYVSVRERARRHTEQTCGASRLEMNPEHVAVRAGVELERPAVAAGNDRAMKSPLVSDKDSKLVRVEVDDELDGSARDDALAQVTWSVAQGPEVLHVFAKRRTGSMSKVSHVAFIERR
jgi:hypothetical protein